MIRMGFILSAALLLGACGSDDKTDKGGDTAKKADAPKGSSEACYQRVQARDTFALRIVSQGENVTGDLGFDNFEKDSSKGRVTGKKTGDVYRLLYVFQSEGMTSVMEIFFREEGKGLVRGVGEMETVGDTVRYANPAAVRYPSGERWEQVDCTPAR